MPTRTPTDLAARAGALAWNSRVAASLTLVVCAAPLTARTPDVAGALVAAGRDVTVVGSPASRAWLDPDAVRAVTGSPVLFDQRRRTGPRAPAGRRGRLPVHPQLQGVGKVVS